MRLPGLGLTPALATAPSGMRAIYAWRDKDGSIAISTDPVFAIAMVPNFAGLAYDEEGVPYVSHPDETRANDVYAVVADGASLMAAEDADNLIGYDIANNATIIGDAAWQAAAKEHVEREEAAIKRRAAKQEPHA